MTLLHPIRSLTSVTVFPTQSVTISFRTQPRCPVWGWPTSPSTSWGSTGWRPWSADNARRWSVVRTEFQVISIVTLCYNVVISYLDSFSLAELTEMIKSFHHSKEARCAPSSCQDDYLPWPGKPGECFQADKNITKVKFAGKVNMYKPKASCW